MNRRLMLPLFLTLLMIFNAALAGCNAQEPTPTPTKTPSLIPSITPTLTPTATGTSTWTPVPPTPTPMPTATATQVQIAAVLPTPTSTATSTPEPTTTATLSPTVATKPQSTQKSVAAKPTTQPAPVSVPLPQSVTLGGDVNPLTGLRVDPARLNRRPLGVKIANFPVDARPQSGLSLADVVIEYEAEAFLTRFTAIFYGNDVGLLGPIRSLRLSDAEWMPIFKAALVASGGHPGVKIRITEGKAWAAGYKRIICPEDPFTDGGAEYRMPEKKSRYELTMYSDTATLWNVLNQRGVNTRQDFHNMFVFSETPPGGGRGATHLRIVYKPTYSIAEYRYDAATNTYKRFDLGVATVDELTGRQLAASNVVIIIANHYNSDILTDTHDPNNPYYAVIVELWGQGTAKLMRDGKVYDIRWVRENAQQDSDRLIFVDDQGNQVPFRPGQTWIQVVRPNGDMTID